MLIMPEFRGIFPRESHLGLVSRFPGFAMVDFCALSWHEALQSRATGGEEGRRGFSQEPRQTIVRAGKGLLQVLSRITR